MSRDKQSGGVLIAEPLEQGGNVSAARIAGEHAIEDKNLGSTHPLNVLSSAKTPSI